jgi:hypothetical protein
LLCFAKLSFPGLG